MTFAVLVFLGMVFLLLAVARGLYNVTATYHYSEETAYEHGAHQAGVTIKKYAHVLSYAVCTLHVQVAIAQAKSTLTQVVEH